MPYMQGLLEGFQGAAAQRREQAFQQDESRRQREGQLYQYLLQSTDPSIKALAMSGLFESAQPGSRAKGLRGFMGEVEGGKIWPQMQALMDSPAEDQGAPPAFPGSAAMPQKALTQPSHPPTLTPDFQQAEDEFAAAPPPGPAVPEAPPAAPPSLSAHGLMGQPMGTPKRRGTQVPTAEEIAESSALAGVRGKIRAVQGSGLSPDNQQRAIMGALGAPVPLDSTANGPVVVDPEDPKTPIPTVRHRDGTITLLDGTPLPSEYVGYVKPTAAGGLTSTIKDTPAIRAQYGIDASTPNPSGYWKIKQLPDGTSQVMASEYTPPPAYSGTTTIAGANGGPAQVVPIDRGGGLGAPLGDAPPAAGTPTNDEADAKAIVESVDKEITGARRPGFPIKPGARDEATKRLSGGRYRTYVDAQKAAQKRPQTSAGSSGIDAAAIRQRMEQNRRSAGGQ